MFKNVDLFQIDKASWASCVIFGTRKGGVQAGTQLRGVLEIKKKLLAALRHQRQVPTHSSAVSIYLAVPSMVLQYSAANLVMSCSSVALWSSTGSP